MKKILILFAAVFALVSCEMDLYRSDQMNSAMLAENPSSAIYTTDGNYAMFKDELEFGMTDRGGFARIYWLMTELRSDNVIVSDTTEDPLETNSRYCDTDRQEDLSYMWYICYKIIYGCNMNIESLTPGESVETDHIIGENYFLRAVAHFSLCNLFATPYVRGKDNPGIIIRTESQIQETKRASVGEVYAQIESDLKDAMKYMKDGVRRGNHGFADYNAACGLLSRLYLYMERNDECVQLCNDMLGGDPASHLDSNYDTYFARALESDETLWCIGRYEMDDSYVGSVKGQLSSMFYKPADGSFDGWCEDYWSEPLIDLLMAHPEDIRAKYFHTYGNLNDGKKYIVWPAVDPGTENRVALAARDVTFDESAVENTFSFNNVTYTVKRKQGNGYPIYYIEGMYPEDKDQDIDGDGVAEGTRCWVRDNISKTDGMRKGLNYPMYGMSKFTGQDGYPALSSPVYIRWAEVILNRAEANAKLGNDAAAIADVNIIRKRAGIPEWSVDNIGGYKNVLDVVLDERRLEFSFEGLRVFDVYRNGKDLDRRFYGIHAYEVITPDQMDIWFPYCIPYTETSVSGIPGNGRQ